MSNHALIQNFSFPGEICRKFALDWSQDNKIAVSTSKAVYIMTSYCSPVENDILSPLHKQVILAPDKVMQLQPIAIPPNPYAVAESFSDEVNMYQILMDHTLNPTPPERSEAFRGYRCAKWSPKGAAKGGRCILAALTMDHRLILYEEIHDDWVCICDLSEVLKGESEEIKEATELSDKLNKQQLRKKKKAHDFNTRNKTKKSEQLSEEELHEDDADADVSLSEIFNYEVMKTRTYKFAPVEITWTGMFGAPASSINESSYEYCYLIVAMKSGHIQFWKICSSESRIISLAHEWDSELGLLTAICWQQTSPSAGFLMCGTLKGVFAFLPVTLRNDLDQEPIVTVKEMCKVWDEEDLVCVDQIAVLKIALKKYVVIAAKQHALVGCEILLTDSSIIIRNVGHSFGLHKLPVTGMCVLDPAMPQYRLLISTMEGLFVEIKISVKDDEIKFQHEKISVDLDLMNMMVQGMAISPNGILCSAILSTVTYFDHLEKKEPLQFATFMMKPFEEIIAKLKTILKPAFSFLPTSNSNFSRYSDFLECIRIRIAVESNEPALPEWMTSFLDSDPETYKNASELELYMMRYLLHSYVSGLAAVVPRNKGDLEAKLCSVESAIMRNYVSKIFGSCQDKIDLLTPAQGQSLLLMADWLLKEFHMPVDSLYSALGCETPSDAENLPARESCRICKTEVRLNSIKMGKCAKDHTFPRCCQSLLLCDMIPYYRCMSCKSVALQDVWGCGLTCTYCGMMMA